VRSEKSCAEGAGGCNFQRATQFPTGDYGCSKLIAPKLPQNEGLSALNSVF